MSALHPFSLLAIAAALPAFAWILPAPGGALATTLVALGLTLTPGASPGFFRASLAYFPRAARASLRNAAMSSSRMCGLLRRMCWLSTMFT